MKLVLVVVSSLVALACERAPSSSPSIATQVRDSAGIVIVENGEPAADSRLAWLIGPEPVVSIGEVDGAEPYLLSRVQDATMLHDGRIVVVNGGTEELRVFDSDGIHQATWGGQGDGPGEFRDLQSVEPWRGDSIIAWYSGRLGLQIFDGQGNYGRAMELEHDRTVPVSLRFFPQQATRDGSLVAVHSPQAADTVVVQLMDAQGRVRSSLGKHVGYEPYLYAEGTEQQALFLTIFGREPVWTRWGDLVVIGHTGRYELRAFDADGSLARIIRRYHIPLSPTSVDVETEIERQLGSLIGVPGYPESMIEDSRRMWASVPVAESFPAFEKVMSDATDHLWVGEYEFGEGGGIPSLWTVFDPEGRALGLVKTPEGLWIHEIGSDYVMGTARDELGIEYVQVWRLERTR